MIISTTQFKLKTWLMYVEFFIDTLHVTKQIKQTNGVIKLKLNPVNLRTITAWKSKEDMLKFINCGAHLSVMKKSQHFGEIYSTHWEADSFPYWQEAIERLEKTKRT